MDREIYIVRPDKLIPLPQEGKVKVELKDDKIFIHAPEVSKPHAVITIKNDEIFIKDLDSLNGVYINGFRIKEAMLNRKGRDKVVIAKKYPIDSTLLKLFKKEIDRDIDPNDYKEEFLELKKVYDNYQIDKKMAIRKHQNKTNIQRFIIVTLPTVLFIIIAHKWLALGDMYFPIYITLSAALACLLPFVNTENNRLQETDRMFKKKYKCPKCKLMLNQEWDVHREDRECPRCKAIWSD